MQSSEKKKWYQRIPHAYALLFYIIVLAAILSWVVPAGQYDRVEVDGRTIVDPGSFRYVDPSPVGLLNIFRALPLGMRHAADIVFLIFIAGGFLKLLDRSGALKASIGILGYKFKDRPGAGVLMIFVMTYAFGFLGGAIGFETCIPFIPLILLVSKTMGYDSMTAAAMAVGGVAVGFATWPINPYTVGVSHFIADLPLFSGVGLRIVYFVLSLGLMAAYTTRYAGKIKRNPELSLVSDLDAGVAAIDEDASDYELTPRRKAILAVFAAMLIAIIYGTTQLGWFILEISMLFVMAAVIVGIIERYEVDKFCTGFIEGMASMTLGAVIVGVARGITVVLEMGKINDTIIHTLVRPLEGLPTMVSAVLMSVVHGVINFFIPSGSGQAMATMPIMIPIADIVGMTRQTAVHAFQVGDGLMNLIVPTLGGLLAMLYVAGVPYERWVRFIWKVVIMFLVLGWILTVVAVLTNYGPF